MTVSLEDLKKLIAPRKEKEPERKNRFFDPDSIWGKTKYETKKKDESYYTFPQTEFIEGYNQVFPTTDKKRTPHTRPSGSDGSWEINPLVKNMMRSPVVQKGIDFLSNIMPLEDWERFEQAEIEAFPNTMEEVKSGISGFMKASFAVGSPNPKAILQQITPEEQYNALKMLSYPLKQLERPIGAVRGAVESDKKGEPLKGLVRGFFLPEETQPITRSLIPLTQFEKEGSVARLIPRAVAEAVETVLMYDLMYHQGNMLKGIAQHSKEAKYSRMFKEFDEKTSKMTDIAVQKLEEKGLFPEEWNQADKFGATKAYIQKRMGDIPEVGDFLAKRQSLLSRSKRILASEKGGIDFQFSKARENLRKELTKIIKSPTESNLRNAPIEALEAYIDVQYELNAPQEKLDKLETIYDERISEDNLNVVEHEINISEAEGIQGAGLEEQLADTYYQMNNSEYITKEQSVERMRSILEDYGMRSGGMKKGVTDEQIVEAAKEAYDDRKARLTRLIKGKAIKAKKTPTIAEGKEAFPTAETTLESEAKGKTLEEFVGSQGVTVFRGTNKGLEDFEISKGGQAGAGIYFTPDKNESSKYGKNISEVQLKLNNPFTIKRVDIPLENTGWRRSIEEQGFDGIIIQDINGKIDEYVAFNIDQIKTKQQLTEIWNKANAKVTEETTLEAEAKGKTLEEFVGEQGKPFYHGTGVDFNKFSKEELGRTTGAISAKEGIFFSSNPYVSASYIVPSLYNKEGFSDIESVIQKQSLLGIKDEKLNKFLEITDKFKDEINKNPIFKNIDYLKKLLIPKGMDNIYSGNLIYNLNKLNDLIPYKLPIEMVKNEKAKHTDVLFGDIIVGRIWDDSGGGYITFPDNLEPLIELIKDGIFSIELAKKFGVKEPIKIRYLPKDIKMKVYDADKKKIKLSTAAKNKSGYDVKMFKNIKDPLVKATNIVMFEPSKGITSQQLTEIWNKANKSNIPSDHWWKKYDYKKELDKVPLRDYEYRRDFEKEGYVPITRDEADNLHDIGSSMFVSHIGVRGEETTGEEGYFMKPEVKGRKMDEEERKLYGKYKTRYEKDKKIFSPGREVADLSKTSSSTGEISKYSDRGEEQKFGDLRISDVNNIPENIYNSIKGERYGKIPERELRANQERVKRNYRKEIARLSKDERSQTGILRDSRLTTQNIVTIDDAVSWLEKRGLYPEDPTKYSISEAINKLQAHKDFAKISIFDRARLAAQLERVDRPKEYSQRKGVRGVNKKTVSSTTKVQNKKTVSTKGTPVEIYSADTTRGCDNFCIECYGLKASPRAQISHQVPINAAFHGIINKGQLLRIGDIGDAAKDWGHANSEIGRMLKRSVDRGNDVSAENNIFFVTKLQSIKGFNPSIAKNLEISLDPIQPAQMTETLSNILKIKKLYPEVNMSVRIRSLRTHNNALKASQDFAIEFAKKFNIPVLETKMRFRRNSTLDILEIDKSKYVYKDNQWKLKESALQKKSNLLHSCDEGGTGECVDCMNCSKLMIDDRSSNIKKQDNMFKKFINKFIDKMGSEVGSIIIGEGGELPEPPELDKEVLEWYGDKLEKMPAEDFVEFEKSMHEEMNQPENNLYVAIKKLGGIKPYKGGYLKEEMQAIPLHLKNAKTGFTLDDLVYQLRQYGYDFEYEDELREAIKEFVPPGKLDKAGLNKILAYAKAKKKWAINIIKTVGKALRPIKVPYKAIVRGMTGQVKIDSERDEWIPSSVALKEVLSKEQRVAREAYRKATKEQKAITKEKLNELRQKINAEKDREEKKNLVIKFKAMQRVSKQVYFIAKKEGISLQKAHQAFMDSRKKARQRITKMIENLRKVDIGKLRPEYKGLVKNLLEDLTLTSPSKRTLEKFAAIRHELETNPESEFSKETLAKMAEVEKKSVRELDVEELKVLHDAVIHLDHLSKTKNKLILRQRNRDHYEVLREVVDEMKPWPEIEKDFDLGPDRFANLVKMKKALKETFGVRSEHYDLIIETLAGADSKMMDILFNQLREGLDNKLRYSKQRMDQLNDGLIPILEKHKITNLHKWATSKVKFGNITMTRGQRAALYAHSMNEDNVRHIVEGGVVTNKEPNKVYPIRESYFNNLINSMEGSPEQEIANLIVDILTQQGDKIAPVYLERTGLEFEQVGSYYPIRVAKVGMPTDMEAESIIEEYKGKMIRIGLNKGFVNPRVKSKLSIMLNNIFSDFLESIAHTGQYINLEIPLTNASKLLYDKVFSAELKGRYGSEIYREIEKGLRDIVINDAWNNYSSTEKILMLAKNRIVTGILGLNPFVVLKQPLSFALYSVYVKPEYMIKAMVDYVDPSNAKKIIAQHKQYSPMFQERLEGGYSRDVSDVLRERPEARIVNVKKPIREKVMKTIALFDAGTVSRGMYGAVLQRLDELKGSDLTVEEKMVEAYRFADEVTSKTQPMFQPEYRSSISRGKVVEKLATSFTTQLNQNLNLIRRLYRTAKRTGKKEDWDRFYYAIVLIGAVIPLGLMAIDETRNVIYGRKKYTDVTFKDYGKAVLNNSGAMFYFVRDAVTSLMSKVQKGSFRGYDVSVPVLDFINGSLDTASELIRAFDIRRTQEQRSKSMWKFWEGFLETILMGYGIPYRTPKKLTQAATGNNKKYPRDPKEVSNVALRNLIKPNRTSRKKLKALISPRKTPSKSDLRYLLRK